MRKEQMKLVFDDGKSLESNIERKVESIALSTGKAAKTARTTAKAVGKGVWNGLAKAFEVQTNSALQAEVDELRAIVNELKARK